MVQLPGGNAASQNDIYVIAKSHNQLVSIMAELVGLDVSEVNHLRYQLLHRTASALIEARRLLAPTAVVLVHSFSQDYKWFEDFESFVKSFGLAAEKDFVVGPKTINGIDLYFAWLGERRSI